MLAGAVSAAAGGVGARSTAASADVTASGTLIPPNLRDSAEKISFIAAQRERLNIVLSALDKEAQDLQAAEAERLAHPRAHSMNVDGGDDDDNEPTQRPPSGLSVWSALSKSRSEADFEKIEAESGAEDEGVRRRNPPSAPAASGGSWMPWGWGGAAADAEEGESSALET